jgi:dethiobiotin synthetase
MVRFFQSQKYRAFPYKPTQKNIKQTSKGDTEVISDFQMREMVANLKNVVIWHKSPTQSEVDSCIIAHAGQHFYKVSWL